MSDSISIRQTVNSLVKVANSMIDSVEGQESQKLSPEEALQAIEEIISQLEQVADGIPAESAPQEQEPVEATAPAPEEKPVAPDPRVAQLEKEVAVLKAQSEEKDRNIILEKIASFYTDGDEKFKSIKEAKESIPVLTARLETLTELTGKNGSTRVAQTGTVSYQKFAQLVDSGDRRHTL